MMIHDTCGVPGARPDGSGTRLAQAELNTAATAATIIKSVRMWSRHCLMTINHAATIGPCGPRPRPPGASGAAGAPAGGAGAGPRSGWKRYALCVTGSTAIVFAPANVATVATTVYLSGASWWTTVTLPSPPFGMYISFFDGSHPRASTRVPFVMGATILPVLASTTTDVLLHPAKM